MLGGDLRDPSGKVDVLLGDPFDDVFGAIAVAVDGVLAHELQVDVVGGGAARVEQRHEVDAVADLLHALHAATGVHVPCNEEWHHTPTGVDLPLPWRIVLKWRVSTLAGFEGGTKIYVNTIDPWALRDRVVTRLHALADEGRLADGIRLSPPTRPDASHQA